MVSIFLEPMKRLFFALTFALVSPTISAKSQAFIQERAREITELLVRRGAEILVLARNTATAAIAYILGLDIPDDWRGKPMVQIFK